MKLEVRQRDSDTEDLEFAGVRSKSRSCSAHNCDTHASRFVRWKCLCDARCHLRVTRVRVESPPLPDSLFDGQSHSTHLNASRVAPHSASDTERWHKQPYQSLSPHSSGANLLLTLLLVTDTFPSHPSHLISSQLIPSHLTSPCPRQIHWRTHSQPMPAWIWLIPSVRRWVTRFVR